MKKFLKTHQTLILLFFLSCLVAGTLYQTAKHFNKFSAQEYVGIYDRNFIETPLKQNTQFEVDFDIYRMVPYQDRLYILPSKPHSITIVDSVGNFQQKIGTLGNGPEEFRLIIDMAVGFDKIMVVDKVKSAIMEINHQGHFTHSSHYDKQMTRASFVGKNNCIIKYVSASANLENKEEEFEFIDLTTQEKKIIRVPFVTNDKGDDNLYNLQMDGHLIASSDRVFRTSMMAGYFAAFDSTGKFLYQKQTIDKSPLPPVVQSTTGKGTLVQIGANARQINLGAAANSKFLFIFSNAASPSIKDSRSGLLSKQVIDVYEAANGNYKCSFYLPEHQNLRATTLTADDSSLYVVYKGNHIVKYTLLNSKFSNLTTKS